VNRVDVIARDITRGFEAMPIQICTAKERPDLLAKVWDQAFMNNWPNFIHAGLIGNVFYDSFFLPSASPFADFLLIGFDPDEQDQILARAFSLPFAFGPEVDRPDLPEAGWDQVVVWADWDQKAGRKCNAVSAIEINVKAHVQGQGLSSLMLKAMRDNAHRLGFQDLYAPVRPNQKHLEPHTPMAEYAFRVRKDGLPFDPWLRVHARAGANIIQVASTSMTFSGSLAQWRDWTGLPFDQTAEVIVPGALAPVSASVEHNRAVYVEANVWMHHQVRA
jgi:GNAT superfamily N-acetyltransferase